MLQEAHGFESPSTCFGALKKADSIPNPLLLQYYWQKGTCTRFGGLLYIPPCLTKAQRRGHALEVGRHAELSHCVPYFLQHCIQLEYFLKKYLWLAPDYQAHSRDLQGVKLDGFAFCKGTEPPRSAHLDVREKARLDSDDWFSVWRNCFVVRHIPT